MKRIIFLVIIPPDNTANSCLHDTYNILGLISHPEIKVHGTIYVGYMQMFFHLISKTCAFVQFGSYRRVMQSVPCGHKGTTVSLLIYTCLCKMQTYEVSNPKDKSSLDAEYFGSFFAKPYVLSLSLCT